MALDFSKAMLSMSKKFVMVAGLIGGTLLSNVDANAQNTQSTRRPGGLGRTVSTAYQTDNKKDAIDKEFQLTPDAYRRNPAIVTFVFSENFKNYKIKVHGESQGKNGSEELTLEAHSERGKSPPLTANQEFGTVIFHGLQYEDMGSTVGEPSDIATVDLEFTENNTVSPEQIDGPILQKGFLRYTDGPVGQNANIRMKGTGIVKMMMENGEMVQDREQALRAIQNLNTGSAWFRLDRAASFKTSNEDPNNFYPVYPSAAKTFRAENK